ncbi:MAG TPA: hypothetical protein PLO14_03525 [Accumulibacter sp.]|uniref:hypothetical protein n=1 Tax=Accumulibacter sp. TaxID=2053492 RepID=UPI0025D13C81|nr:hypothetical protein [Accumulibacter sp.]MCM8600534.1 hypothetical protein [Accumulibacter sp.]MCM8664240.1 hypothetical protein [Accumulibacter sp.]HNC51300.1 hypothetical protein [Accumulibacter sp.]
MTAARQFAFPIAASRSYGSDFTGPGSPPLRSPGAAYEAGQRHQEIDVEAAAAPSLE